MRLQGLDVFMAGDDVDKKKPDPSIYRIAAERLKVDPKECLVVEDSTIGLQVDHCHSFACQLAGHSAAKIPGQPSGSVPSALG